MSVLTNDHMIEISELVDSYFHGNQMIKAKEVLEREIQNYPEEHWLFTTLANVYYEMRNYNKALEFSEMALKIESSDFLVINNHACILSVMDGKELEAVKFLKKIINASIDKIAYGYYGEGMKWAKSLVNDNRVRLGLVYSSMNNKKMARKYLEEHLSNRQRGLFSNFEKKYVLSKITSLG